MDKAYLNNRANFMTSDQKTKLGTLPRTHANCLEKCGVKRPGKTRQDRARKHGA